MLWDAYSKVPTRDSKTEYGNSSWRSIGFSGSVFPAEPPPTRRLVGTGCDSHPLLQQLVPIAVLEFMVMAFVKSGDRESLVELLSKRCPSRTGLVTNIEYCVAYSGWRLRTRS